MRSSTPLHLHSTDCYCARAHIGQKFAQCGCTSSTLADCFILSSPNRHSSAVLGNSSAMRFAIDRTLVVIERTSRLPYSFTLTLNRFVPVLERIFVVSTNRPEAAKYSFFILFIYSFIFFVYLFILNCLSFIF